MLKINDRKFFNGKFTAQLNKFPFFIIINQNKKCMR